MGRLEKVKKFFRDNFLSGFLVLVPVVVSLYVFIQVARWLYRKLVILPIDNELITSWLSPVIPDWGIVSAIKLVHMAEFFLVLALVVVATTLVGLFTKIRFTNWLFKIGERILQKIPLIGVLYSGLKQFLQAIFSGKGNFSKAVLVEFPKTGVWSVGFVSRDSSLAFEKLIGRKKLYNVFVPTVPNITTGFIIIVPQDQVIETAITIDQAFKFIMSGGMVLPDEEAIAEPGRTSFIDRIKGAAVKQEGKS